MRSLNETKTRAPRRYGASMIEVVVSAVLLMTFMTFVTTLCFRVNLVWSDVAHQRFAVGELANQLDSLTRLSKDEALQELQSLKPSSACEQTLNTPSLTGKMIEDKLGTRITLQLDWERGKPGLPVELAGWLVNSNQESEAPPEANAERDKETEKEVEAKSDKGKTESKESDQ